MRGRCAYDQLARIWFLISATIRHACGSRSLHRIQTPYTTYGLQICCLCLSAMLQICIYVLICLVSQTISDRSKTVVQNAFDWSGLFQCQRFFFTLHLSICQIPIAKRCVRLALIIARLGRTRLDLEINQRFHTSISQMPCVMRKSSIWAHIEPWAKTIVHDKQAAGPAPST